MTSGCWQIGCCFCAWAQAGDTGSLGHRSPGARAVSNGVITVYVLFLGCASLGSLFGHPIDGAHKFMHTAKFNLESCHCSCYQFPWGCHWFPFPARDLPPAERWGQFLSTAPTEKNSGVDPALNSCQCTFLARLSICCCFFEASCRKSVFTWLW